MATDMRCGIGAFQPQFLQCCARIGAFTGVYSMSALFTSILSVYIGSQITAIEKQFGLSSTQSGLLLSGNDLGFLLTTIFFSYVARRVHIPRSICLSSLLYGIGGFMCAIPYFISRDYVLRQTHALLADTTVSGGNGPLFSAATSSNIPLCQEGVVLHANASSCEFDMEAEDYGVGKPNRYTSSAIALIGVGMILQGIGKAPRSPFVITYIEDNGKKKNTAMYIGIITGLAIFGPAIAFTVGGVFSRQYVTLEDVPLSPGHPAWIGAWWLGFVVFSLVTIVMSTPLLLFPKQMKPKPISVSKESSTQSTKYTTSFLRSLVRLFTNPVYLPLQINNFLQTVIASGVVMFFPKYFETQFFIPAWKANILLGTGVIIIGALGSFLGGIVVSKAKLTPVTCVKVVIAIYTMSVVRSGLGFFIGCSNADIAGFNMDNNHIGTNFSCSTSCGCHSVTYFPVCGSNNINYMSPCHAGCSDQKGMVFQNCTCIDDMTNITATAGLCETTCTMLYPYLILNAIAAFLGFFGIIPGFIVTIRSVSDEDKPVSIGLSSVITTVAYFIGAIFFGRIIDGTCLLWSSSCIGSGACALYDNDVFRFRIHLLMVITSVVGVLMLIIVLTRATKKTDWSSQENSRVGDLPEEEKFIPNIELPERLKPLSG